MRLLVGASVAAVAFILFLTWLALRVHLALAGFLNGDSTWMAVQNRAVVDLLQYADTGEETDLARFNSQYSTLATFRSVRDQLLSRRPDMARAISILSNIHATEVPLEDAVFVFAYFSGAPHIRQAIAQWKAADPLVDELETIAETLRQSNAYGAPLRAELQFQRARIRTISSALVDRSLVFSSDIAQGAVLADIALFFGVLGTTALAIGLWLLAARRILSRLRSSEKRYRLLFDSAPDAIVIADQATGAVLDANRTALEWRRKGAQRPEGMTYTQWFNDCALHEVAPGDDGLQSGEDGQRVVETQTSVLAWGLRTAHQSVVRDISERVRDERDRHIAAAALANTAEGILIVNARGRVVSPNRAATEITGYTKADLLEMCLEDTRCMADGSAMQISVRDMANAVGRWSGEVQSRRKDGSTYPESLTVSAIRENDQIAVYYVAVFSDISDIREARRHLERLALHDSLTGLVNRAELQRRCDAAIGMAAQVGKMVAVLFIDLDGFKAVNDRYGHAAGDELLQLVSERIYHQQRAVDTVGRIGGDEFVVLLTELERREDAASAAERILAALSRPFKLDSCEAAVGASIGIACTPQDGDRSQTLIANADAAMYAAKSCRPNTWRFHQYCEARAQE
ncbi:diguanylate cyclase [Castellaniella sp.]|uniref:diguanylate cyclase domain-containing protein n=1 Tax=Castellaniella sp. TaxID=1955812 RepID=UPI0025C1405E|nr:diguanylate cyclase [Castellaniella sp.]